MGHLLTDISPISCLSAGIPRYYPSLNSISLCLIVQRTLPLDRNRVPHYQGFAFTTTYYLSLSSPGATVFLSIQLGLSPQHMPYPSISRLYILPLPLMQPEDIIKPMRRNVVMTGTHFVVSPPWLKAHTRINSLPLLTFIVSFSSICMLHLKSHASQVCSFLLWATSHVLLSPSTHLPKLGKFGLALAPSIPPSS